MIGQTIPAGTRDHMPPADLTRLRLNIFFESVDDDLFGRLVPRLAERRYRGGDVIVEDDADGLEIFILVEGRVKIIKRTKNGADNLLALLHAGDFFGELELVDGRPRSARVVALEDCHVYSLKKTDFDRLLQESHAFAVRLMQVMSVRLRALNNRFISETERSHVRSAAELQKLANLMEASKALNSTLDLAKLLDIILETALKTVQGERGTVYLVDAKAGELFSFLQNRNEQVTIRLPMGKGIAGYVAASGDTLNIEDAYLDPRFNPEVDRRTGYRTKTMLCMPMKDKDGKIIGVFQLLNKLNGLFTPEDENFISALSVHASLALENARLYEEEKALGRMREEIRLAAKIQTELLPTAAPRLKGYDIAGSSIPAEVVGGDYFDFIPLDGGRLAIGLGDVSGKGMPAALLMSNLQATLRGQMAATLSPAECVSRSNRLLFESTSPEKFVTLFFGVLDPAAHRFTYANAGHEYPLLFGGNGSRGRLDDGGLVLGIVPDYPYKELSLELAPGELLVIYSDGVSEAQNSTLDQFGDRRLIDAVERHKDRTSAEIIEAVVAAASKFAGSQPQFDDMTMVIIRRTS